ncbi:MAG: hypothetical protein RLZZ502_1384 [Pseudomonadota bacterium]|jgi:uncharacterized protein YigA (DUF484 family)
MKVPHTQIAPADQFLPDLDVAMVQDFLLKHPDVLTDIQLPLNDSERTVSLAGKQMMMLRERSQGLESYIEDMHHNGRKNMVLDQKVHRLCLALLSADTLPMSVAVILESLTQDFNVPQVALRWWQASAQAHDIMQPVSTEFEQLMAGLAKPQITAMPIAESAQWLTPDIPARSFAYLPLRKQDCLGALLLASPDPERFAPEMATDVLLRLSELVTAAIARFRHMPEAISLNA